MWIFLIIAAVLAYFAIPMLLEHREKMAQLKGKDKKDRNQE